MALAVEEDVTADPRGVRFLDPLAVVRSAEGLADTVEEPRLRDAFWPDVARGQGGPKRSDGV